MRNPDPADWKYSGGYYIGPSEDMQGYNDEFGELVDVALQLPRHAEAHSGPDTNRVDKLTGRCDHCGARHFWGACFIHIPTNTYMAVGHTCAADIFDMPDAAAKAKRRAQKYAHNQAEARKHRAAKIRSIIYQLKHTAHLQQALKTKHRIVKSLRQNMAKWGQLTENQTNLLWKLASEAYCPIREERVEEAPTKEAPNSRVTVVGTVLGTKEVDNPYGRCSILKMLVKVDDGGWKLFVTVPSNIDGYDYDKHNGVKGLKLQFTATVKQSKNDKYFAYGKRPTKCRVM